MIQKIVSLKAWVLFVLMFIPGIISSIISEPGVYSQLDIIANLICAIVYFLWLWAIISLAKLSTGEETSVFLRVCFLGTTLVFVGYNLCLILGLSIIGSYREPISIVALVLWIYCLFMIAKNLKSAELHRSPRIGEYLVDFLMMLIFPIGVWILQPRLNRMQRDGDF
jgi:hypothetical protein